MNIRATFSVLFILFAAGTLETTAQTKTGKVKGRVFFTNNYGIRDAHIRFISGKDTITVTSLPNGDFVANEIPVGKVNVKATHASFAPFESGMEVVEGNNMIFIEMKRLEIAGAVVKAEVPLMTHRKDTIIYHAAAVKTRDGENAIAILEHMPGVSVRGGKVYIDGQVVKRTYVNGRLIFGENVSAPLNHMLASDVTNIKSYEEDNIEDKRRNLKNGRKDRVLDITTKNPIFSAFDGFVLAAAGADQAKTATGGIQPRYIGGINANFFSEHLLAHLKVLANNVGLAGNNFNTYTEMPGSLKEYKETGDIEAGLKKAWGGKFNRSYIEGSYALRSSEGNAFSFNEAEYFETAGSPGRTSSDSSQNLSRGHSHEVKVSLLYNGDKFRGLKFDNIFEVNDNRTESLHNSKLIIPSFPGILQSRRIRNSDQSYRIYNSLFWQDSFAESGLTAIVIADFEMKKNHGLGFTVDTLASSFDRKYLVSEGNGHYYTSGANIHLMKRLINKEKGSLSLGPTAGFSVYDNSRRMISTNTLDPLLPVADLANTFDFTWRGYNALVGFFGDFTFGNIYGNIHFYNKFSRVTDDEAFPEAYSKEHRFVMPDLFASISFGGKGSLDFKSSSSIPAVEQLRDRIDDRNPLLLVAGNSSLKAPQVNDATFSFHPYSKGNNRLSLTGSFGWVTNPIVTRSVFYASDTHVSGWGGYDIKAGSMLNSFENAPYSLSYSSSVIYSTFILRNQSKLEFSANFKGSERPQYIGEELVLSDEYVPSFSTLMTYRPRSRYMFKLTHNLHYYHSVNSRGQTLVSEIGNNLYLSASVLALKYFIIRGNYSLSTFDYLKGMYKDISLHHLDLLLGVTLMKGRLGISISANDVLNRAHSFSYVSESNYTSRTWTPSYGRYFLLKVSFRLNKTSPKTTFF